ncbi:50S ribosomal protein L23 [Methanothermobacter wolfeii]|uniref:Large ribosomal subunit protein uL23 n=1 Tax=Methanothermobacter wolfeii TaxID=145261 RepID=A0A9E7RTY2_METWO|nr:MULTISPECIES: 50S ribosomal protein L23 [Methanothermobacter]MDI6702364.1 50S ribosomal protein L23 [Methanothermobacter wolfeii]MDI6841467.1 50S ribosomal protein L23 [Methanothermobacter wolfeii]NLM03250.1 50S ribosomal protein L23 [Methanothermobacter wolfeii]QHN05987.1 50S ribosomal protein L23 [Methanothermobacter sp. THM-1]UXH32154.1 50S ribosomal protein L23 [Methanothermobacter wolfeii]
MDPYAVIVKPHVTEKSMNLIDQNNELAFVVMRKSTKKDIRRAFEELFAVKVERVNTQVTPKGHKLAYIKLAKEHSAEDIAVKLGVF